MQRVDAVANDPGGCGGMRGAARLAVLVWALVLAPLGARAEVPLEGRILFRSDLAPESTLRIELGEWTESERAAVTALFAVLDENVPGLLARASAAGAVSLYRTAGPSPQHPAAAWARRRHEASVIFRDDFFRSGRPNHLGVDYSNWLFVHEVVHLADPVGQIARSREWRALIEPRIARVEERLAARGLTVREAMFSYLDAPALEEGLPSVYAALSLHEALSEYAAAYLFGADFAFPEEIAEFLLKRLFSAPSPAEITIATAYRKASRLNREGDGAGAEAVLSAALAQVPDFAMGYYLRGYVRLAEQDYAGADRDWEEALRLIPASDRREREELATARAYLRERMSEGDQADPGR